jgi:D-amino-acid dehydrogenase
MRIIIVGSGLLGTTSAYFLSLHGEEVMVVDRAEGPARETSFANGGMLTPSQSDPWNAPGVLRKALSWLGKEDAPLLLRPRALPSLGRWGLAFLHNSTPRLHRRNTIRNVRLARYSLDTLRTLRGSTGLRYDGYGGGTLKVFRDQPPLEHGIATAEMLSAHGVQYRALEPAGLLEVEPALAPVANRLVGGIHYPYDEAGDAHAFCTALAALAEERGVQFRFHTRVERLRRDGKRIAGVETHAGFLEADAFVLAAGSYSPLLAQPLGIRLPIRPVKGYSITVPGGKRERAPRIPVVDDSLHAAVTPLAGRLRVAGTAELAGYDATLTKSRILNLFSLLHQIYPEQEADPTGPTVERWMGFRPMTPDGGAILGHSPYPNLYFATGHGHLGWTMAAGSGKALADLICAKEPDIDLSDYRFDRF